MNHNQHQGFTLVELMIVVAILGILAGVALNSYDRNVDKTRRSDAMGALTGLANAMERHRTETGGYNGAATAGADTGAPGIYATQSPIDGGRAYYDLTITAANANAFTLRATPIAPIDDGIIELDSTNQRRWDENNDGAFTGAAENNWTED